MLPGSSSKLLRFHHLCASQKNEEAQQHRIDIRFPERIVPHINLRDFSKKLPQTGSQFGSLILPDQPVGPQNMDQGIHASKRSKKRIVELQDQPLSLRGRIKGMEFPWGDEYDISGIEYLCFAVGLYRVFVSDRGNDFHGCVPVQGEILRIGIQKSADCLHVLIRNCFMCAI